MRNKGSQPSTRWHKFKKGLYPLIEITAASIHNVVLPQVEYLEAATSVLALTATKSLDYSHFL